MTLTDISLTLHEGLPEWPGDTPYSCRLTWQRARGASVNVSAMTMSPHVGTHADAPFHVDDEWPPIAELSIEAFVGPAVVLDVSPFTEAISLADVARAGGVGAERLLLRTGCTIASGRFPDRWPALTPECARDLVERGLRLLGVDAPSVDERTSTDLPVHHALFAGGAAILENLHLERVTPGRYELLAAPVKIAGGDAAPVRAVLRTLGAE